MHSLKNDHRHLWLLSGTGEGPLIASHLVSNGWLVSVSVVSELAALPYQNLDLENLWVGSLGGVKGIRVVLENALKAHKGYDWIVDATHPFAELISTNLRKACSELRQPLLRFERPIEAIDGASMVSSWEDLASQSLQGKRLLFAIGARYLSQAVDSARQAGAEVFARVLPSPESLRQAFASEISDDHLAVLRPLQGQPKGDLEAALCRRWSIDALVCRQSGGITEQLWKTICCDQGITLWLISRPIPCTGVETLNSLQDLFDRVSNV